MSHSLFDSDVPHPEPSNLTAFAANDPTAARLDALFAAKPEHPVVAFE